MILTTMSAQPQDVTILLRDWSNGDKAALEQLMPLVYQELRKLARSHLRKERRSHTLQPTALIHEAYLRMVGTDHPEWKSRSHFFGVAANLMRQILVDHARKHHAAKRAGGAKVTLDEAIILDPKNPSNLIALDDALVSLARLDPRKARAIELRYFAGFSMEETAQSLNISVATLRRDLRMAEAWLLREMKN
jgi:RNA polymerase sigma factor (TIGR02999 family)